MIILDANILWGVTLNSSTADLLRALRAAGIQVAVPWVVMEELASQRALHYAETHDKAASALGDGCSAGGGAERGGHGHALSTPVYPPTVFDNQGQVAITACSCLSSGTDGPHLPGVDWPSRRHARRGDDPARWLFDTFPTDAG